MKNILIVDDEQPFLLSLQEGLSDQPDYRVMTALNGQEALQVLNKNKIDLLITDLKMPVMDGFSLLAHMSGKFPGIPVIVMTAFGTEEIEQRLKKIDNFYYLEKPLDLELFFQTIKEALAAADKSFIRGINLATFLQLVQLEKKTCTLKIKGKTEVGTLYIEQGNLLSAEVGNLTGQEAAFKIVCWQDPEIEMEAVCRKKDREIEISIEMLLLEAFRIEDEKKEAARQGGNLNPEGTSERTPATSTSETGQASNICQLLEESSGIFYNHETANKISTENSAKGIRLAEQLSEFFHQSGSVVDFGIYVSDDLLFANKTEQTAMLRLRPGEFFLPGLTLGKDLEQNLRHITLRRQKGPRMLLFTRDELQVVVALQPGVRCSELLQKVAQIGSAKQP